jgi:trigger factor
MAEEEQSVAAKNIITIKEAGPCKKKVSIEIPQETITNATDEQYNSLRRDALVPGFRKGRAPRRLLEKRFGKETSEQIKLKLIADATDSAIKDNELDILGEPDVDFEKIEMPAEGPLKFEFEVEVQPQFELPKLEGIPLNKQKVEVTDKQVDKEVEQLRKYSGVWTPRPASTQRGEQDSAVQLDDQIIADVTLKAEDVEEEQKLDNIEIYVRPNSFVAAVPVEKLDELLVGAKAGDTKQTTVDVPKTYFKQEYRGKKVDININIKDIKWLKPAELDEAFLARLGIKDESELREKTREALLHRLETQLRTEMTEQIYQYLLDNTNFDLPLDIVARQADTVLQRQYINLMSQGLSREQVEQQIDQLKAGSDEQAKEQLKAFFIMDKVAEKLEVDVTEEELNGHIAQLAIRQGQRPERLREQMVRDGSLAQFRLEVRQSKCIAKLLESAKITEIQGKKEAKKAGKTTKKSDAKASAGEKKQSRKRKKTAKGQAKR